MLPRREGRSCCLLDMKVRDGHASAESTGEIQLMTSEDKSGPSESLRAEREPLHVCVRERTDTPLLQKQGSRGRTLQPLEHPTLQRDEEKV